MEELKEDALFSMSNDDSSNSSLETSNHFDEEDESLEKEQGILKKECNILEEALKKQSHKRYEKFIQQALSKKKEKLEVKKINFSKFIFIYFFLKTN